MVKVENSMLQTLWYCDPLRLRPRRCKNPASASFSVLWLACGYDAPPRRVYGFGKPANHPRSFESRKENVPPIFRENPQHKESMNPSKYQPLETSRHPLESDRAHDIAIIRHVVHIVYMYMNIKLLRRYGWFISKPLEITKFLWRFFLGTRPDCPPTTQTIKNRLFVGVR